MNFCIRYRLFCRLLLKISINKNGPRRKWKSLDPRMEVLGSKKIRRKEVSFFWKELIWKIKIRKFLKISRKLQSLLLKGIKARRTRILWKRSSLKQGTFLAKSLLKKITLIWLSLAILVKVQKVIGMSQIVLNLSTQKRVKVFSSLSKMMQKWLKQGIQPQLIQKN